MRSTSVSMPSTASQADIPHMNAGSESQSSHLGSLWQFGARSGSLVASTTDEHGRPGPLLALFSVIKAPLSRRVFVHQWPLNTSRWCRCKRQPQFRDEPQAIAEQVPWHRDLGHLERHVADMRDDLGTDLDEILFEAVTLKAWKSRMSRWPKSRLKDSFSESPIGYVTPSSPAQPKHSFLYQNHGRADLINEPIWGL